MGFDGDVVNRIRQVKNFITLSDSDFKRFLSRKKRVVASCNEVV